MSHVDELAQVLAYLATKQLRGFAPPQTDLEVVTKLRKFDYSLDTTFASMSQLLRLALLSRKAVEFPPAEKILWELSFSYNGIPGTLRHGRAGIKLSVWLADGASENPDTIAKDIAERLGSAVKNIQTQVVEPRIDQQRKINNVRVINQHSRYAGFVSYFRVKLDQALANPEEPKDAPPAKPSGETSDDDLLAGLTALFSPLQDQIDRQHEIAYLTTALLAGYFSLVHHRLVLLTGFSPAALETDFSVDKLFGDRWEDQFALATAGRSQQDDNIALSDLHYLAKKYRNALLHGGGGRLADGIFVEWAPGCHSVVTDQGEFTDQFMLWQPALTSADAEDVLSKIDRIEEWFRTLPYFPWIEAGLPVKFDRTSVEAAQEHLQKRTVAKHIDWADGAFDRAMNGEF